MLMVTGIDILHPSGQKNRILYDAANKKYWDSSLFGPGTYSDHLNYIAELNNNYHSSQWGPWRLARSTDIKSLLNKNPLVIITSLFFRTDDSGTIYVWEGRYNKVISPGTHADFGILWKHIDEASGLPSFDYSTMTKSIDDNQPHGTVSAGRMGAWICADSVNNPSTSL